MEWPRARLRPRELTSRPNTPSIPGRRCHAPCLPPFAERSRSFNLRYHSPPHSLRSPHIPSFIKSSEINASARDVFAWHQSPGALASLIPPWEHVTVEQAPPSLADGSIAVLVMRVGPLRLRWVARHRDFIDRGDDGGEFTDEQVSGPFASWVHRHLVRAIDERRCVLEDRIEYALPMGRLGDRLAGWHVRRKLTRMFEFRHSATKAAVRAGA